MKKIFTLLVCLAFSGCVTTKTVVTSYDAFHTAVGAEYIKYVESDPALDDFQKRVRVNNVKATREFINSVQKK
jgi:hypothetical protein